MKRIVEIIPARPGWYARWRLADTTRSRPIALWALLEEVGDGAGREVVGMDTTGRWPGAAHTEPDEQFIRYLFQPPEQGQPEDVEPTERGLPRHVAGVPDIPPWTEEVEPEPESRLSGSRPLRRQPG